MKLVDDPSGIPLAKIAVNFDLLELREEGGRNLNQSDQMWVQMVLLDAVQISIQKEDQENEGTKQEITWSVIGYNQNFLKLQIDFERPEEIS